MGQATLGQGAFQGAIGSSAPLKLNSLRAYWERLRCLSFKRGLAALVPRKYDMYLYRGTRQTLAATPAPSTSLPATIERYGPGGHTGNPDIDNFLVGTREVYVAKVDGVVAHCCALTFSLPRPQQLVSPKDRFRPKRLRGPSTGARDCTA